MSLGDRSPVLVGVGALSQRAEDPREALEPLGLMESALRRAAADAGAPELLTRADSIRAPRGFWDYGDPGRLLAERFGATGARTLLAEIGVLQTTLFGGAARDIAEGRCDIVLLTGAEARYRRVTAERQGVHVGWTEQLGVEADEVLRPHQEIMHPVELQHGIAMPVNQYAVIENALRYADGMDVAAHRDAVATLWAGMSHVAADNPEAWRRDAVSPDQIRDAGPGNRMLAFPYTKLHNSQWNVDQAAGLILCSHATAERLSIPAESRVYPLAVADSNFMIPLVERRALPRSPGFHRAGEAAFTATGLAVDDVTHRELYSCFPSAVRVQQRELGVAADAPVTVTGGMAFAGGPLNNFVLQALVAMARTLRADPGSVGMLNAVSGLLTKQGVSLWSTDARGGTFAFEDVSAAAERDTERAAVVESVDADATVASYTVVYDAEGPERAVVVCDLDDGTRAVADVTDRAAATELTEREGCGRRVRIAGTVGTLH